MLNVLFREAVPGKLPAFCDKELMIGMKIPPALAVVEGMAGAIRASANANPYARPNVLLPKALTNSVATLSPSPVFSNPCQQPAPVCGCVTLETKAYDAMPGLQTERSPAMKNFCCMHICMFDDDGEM